MIDFESCISLEKLVIDNEICGTMLRLVNGIEPKEDFPSLPIFEELLRDKHLLIADHTRKYFKGEDYLPGPVINRANRSRWEEDGSLTEWARATLEIDKQLKSYQPTRLAGSTQSDLTKLMSAEAHKFGMNELPKRD
jgi:trimethylamine--corrinoid protein Co-methyltransferase